MILPLLFVFCSLTSAKIIKCPIKPVHLTAKDDHYKMPRGSYIGGQTCQFKITFPNDTLLQVRLARRAYWGLKFLNISVTDSKKRSTKIFLSNYYFRPPSVTFTMSPGKKQAKFNLNTASFIAVKNTAFKKTIKYTVKSGTEPLVLNSLDIGKGQTAVITRTSKFSLYRIIPDFDPYNIMSFVLFNGTDQVSPILFGSLSDIKDGTVFSKLSIYNSGYTEKGDVKKNGNATERLVFMDSSDASKYKSIAFKDVGRKFQYFNLDAGSKPSLLSLVSFNKKNKSDAYLIQLEKRSTTGRFEIAAFDGLPTKNESRLIQRYNASTIGAYPSRLILSGTKTFVIFKGYATVSYQSLDSSAAVTPGDGEKGIIKGEPSQNLTFIFKRREGDLRYVYFFTWRNNSDAGSKVICIVGNSTLKPFTPITKTFTLKTSEGVTVKVIGRATLDYSIKFA